MDPSTEISVRRKFDIAYFLARENLAFTKMTGLCYLEQRHGVQLELRYRNDHSCSTFVHFIARHERDLLNLRLRCRPQIFFSLQLDGSTDSANIEEELFLALHFDPHAPDGKILACA